MGRVVVVGLSRASRVFLRVLRFSSLRKTNLSLNKLIYILNNDIIIEQIGYLNWTLKHKNDFQIVNGIFITATSGLKIAGSIPAWD